ncbi:MAG TPA: acetyl-CoA carboxylase biotin carboxyl carrier protein subunit [Thermoleophilia bacterium]|nr:acetyl-CoA carboxylase biotin carboxyl carrier protein subunit [Thermoleophilia bacterium]
MTSPLPGKILSIRVGAGDRVAKDQALFIMEAMKMENTIVAEADGIVREIFLRDGDEVETGDQVMDIE